MNTCNMSLVASLTTTDGSVLLTWAEPFTFCHVLSCLVILCPSVQQYNHFLHCYALHLITYIRFVLSYIFSVYHASFSKTSFHINLTGEKLKVSRSYWQLPLDPSCAYNSIAYYDENTPVRYQSNHGIYCQNSGKFEISVNLNPESILFLCED